MTWNYRLIATPYGDGDWLAIHEVYYNKKGKPTSWTVEPVTIGGESYEEVMEVLGMVMRDITKHSILHETERKGKVVLRENVRDK